MTGGFIEFFKGFFETFGPHDWFVNTYVLLYVMTLLIGFNVYLAIKRDGRTEKLSRIVISLGWLGTLYAANMAFYNVGNPAIQQESKLFQLVAQVVYGLHPVFYALLGNFLSSTVSFLISKTE